MTREQAIQDVTNETTQAIHIKYCPGVDEDDIYIKAGMASGGNNGAATAVIDDSTSHITIGGGAGEQVKSVVKALRGLADALETLTEVEG